jgi:hypothetical protein
MFEATTDIVFESPITVIALLPALYVTGKAVWKVRKPLKTGVALTTLIGLLPVFMLFVIGTLTRSAMWTEFGIGLFRFEASIAAGIVWLYDALLAAWLHVFALVVDSLLSISLFQPETWATVLHTVLQSWILVFLLHFAGGVVLVYGLYRGMRMTTTDSLLYVGGVVFILAGLFVALLQDRVVEFGYPVIGVLLVAVIGLQMGVAAMLLGVKPDFSRDTDSEYEDSGESNLRESLVARLEAYLKNIRPGPNDE